MNEANESSEVVEKPKRRWVRRLGWAGGSLAILALLLLLFGPSIASSWVEGSLKQAIADAGWGEATVEELSISWSGDVRLRALRVVRDGEPSLVVDDLRAHVDPWAAAKGRYRFDVAITGPEVTLVETADGRLRAPWDVPFGPASPGGDPSEDSTGESDRSDSSAIFADLVGSLAVTGARLQVRGPDGTSKLLWTGDLETGIAEPGSPLTVNLAARGANEGGITLDGSFDLIREGALDLAGARGQLHYRIEALPLDLVAALLPVMDGPRVEYAGVARGEGRFDLAGLDRITGDGTLELANVRFARADDSFECKTASLRARLPEGDDVRFETELRVDGVVTSGTPLDEVGIVSVDGTREANGFSFDSISAVLPGLVLSGHAVITEGATGWESGTIVGDTEARVDLDALSWLEPFLGGPLPAKGRFALESRASGTTGAMNVRGRLEIETLTVESQDIDWRDEVVTYDATVDASGTPLTITNGLVEGLGQRSELSGTIGAELSLRLKSTIDPDGISRRLSQLSAWSPTGEPVVSELEITGSPTAPHVVGTTDLSPLDLTVADEKLSLRGRIRHDVTPGPNGSVVFQELFSDFSIVSGPENERVEHRETALAVGGRYEPTEFGPRVADGTIDGAIVTGSYAFEPSSASRWEMRGDLRYRPSALGPLIARWVDFDKDGASEQPLSFQLSLSQSPATDERAEEKPGEAVSDGSDAELSGLDALIANLRGTARVGIPAITQSGLTIGGPIDLSIDDAGARLDGALTINGGNVTAAVVLPAASRGDSETEPSISTMLEFSSVGANAKMSTLLSTVHPLFAVDLSALEGDLAGKLGGDLELTYHGDRADLFSVDGFEQLLKLPIGGRGHLDPSSLAVQGAPLIGEILGQLRIPASEAIALDALDFSLRNGRLVYDRPIPMKIDGRETTWTGSIGFDQSLDLVWTLPVDDDLRQRWKGLRELPVGELRIPVGGTARSPRVDAVSALGSVVETSAKDAIGDFLGTGSKGEKVKDLLAEADRKWDAGDQAGAAELYAEIREKHSSTLTYQLNKKRIKRRAKR